ncbi:MAG: helix-turn-helix domain-containing protein [Vogesella sp.]|uniref:helix-turn-helix domain-containing protein n=1 Tax=Vogesella sp. TaxID=1904252 RepID=UPI00391A5DD0
MTTSVAQEIGQQLRDARLAKDLSLHDVADRLKLSLRQLEAIEAGQLEQLPGATFVRGFVRNYARFLTLDSAPLIALLDQVYPPQRVERIEPAAVVPAESNGITPWLLLLPVLLGLLVAVWWLQPEASPAPQAGELAPMQLEDASAPLSAAASQPVAASLPLAVASAPTAQPASASMSARTQAAATAPALAASAVVAAQPASDSKRLRLSASADSWVSVVDATGKRLVFGTIAAGSSQEVNGKPPFKLTIGNAPAMSLSYEGTPVDLKDKTRGSTAKLELN